MARANRATNAKIKLFMLNNPFMYVCQKTQQEYILPRTTKQSTGQLVEGKIIFSSIHFNKSEKSLISTLASIEILNLSSIL